MADILIRGMEMPKSCDVCPFVHENDDLMSDDYRFLDCGFPGMGMFVTDYIACRHPDCQLVEVPPHGRLGDLDRLEKRFTPVEAYYPTEEDRRDYDNGRLMIRDIRSAIKDAPTIIPASEVENDN